MRRYGWILAALLLVGALAMAPAAGAAVGPLLGGKVTCVVQPANGGVRLCEGEPLTYDGVTKIDVNVILPPESGGTEGPYPLIGVFHGWGGEKIGLNGQTEGWAKKGYAVFSMSDRGWGKSCGSADLPDKGLPTCAQGFNHLMDDRYEVRDAQFLIGELADEGIAEPQRIGATGESYGGGISMALAALRDRTMMPDGSLVPWTSPGGKPMAIAAAVPQWPWTDLAYALIPNGRTLDYVAESPYKGPNGEAPIGIEKTSFVTALFGVGLADSNYSPTDTEAAIPTWYARLGAGEPYDGDPTAESILEQVTTYHSSYYINHAEEPAPLLIQSGWNDDLFPPDEALRFYERTRSQFAGDPISLFFMDDGHMRSQNKPADLAVFDARLEAWFAHYLKGEGPAPSSSVETLTTTCGTPSEGPYNAADWRSISPGEIRLDSASPQTIVPGSGDPTSGTAFDPIAGSGACATTSSTDQTGVATYRLPATPEGGFTLMGSPTIVADLESTGPESELAARLVDVSPAGTESLVARGLYRPTAGNGQVVFQLHPQGYRFAPGHVAKLELLPSDSPYARSSNAQLPITVSNLELRLPVLEQPGSLGGVVQAPAPKVVPPGYQLSSEFAGTAAGSGGAAATGAPVVRRGVAEIAGKLRATRKALLVPLHCGGGGACSGSLAVTARKHGGKRRLALAHGGYSIGSGASLRVRLPLSKPGRKAVARALAKRGGHSVRIRGRIELDDSGRPTRLMLTRSIRLAGHRARHH